MTLWHTLLGICSRHSGLGRRKLFSFYCILYYKIVKYNVLVSGAQKSGTPYSTWKIGSDWGVPLPSLLTAEDIWFKCDLYLQFIPSINIWNIWIDLRPFLKCKAGPFSRSWRSPRSNNLEIQNDENSKSKLVKIRWNPKFGLSDLENDLLTSTTSKEAQWIFFKKFIFKISGSS